jgi:endonuclease-3 related protein
MVGAILTQNTNWANVEKAIHNLKRKGLLSPHALRAVSPPTLASLIKPTGYFNIKSKRLKNFIHFLFKEYQGNLKKMASEDTAPLRRKLLSINGIGPETADSILLYALDKPVFVVDAYTKRVLYRHNMIDRHADYVAVQELFMKHLKADVTVFNEYHALLVRLGKDYCKTTPTCEQCPLNNVSYSLKYKCSCCHRALTAGEIRENRQRHDRSPAVCRYCK